MSVMIDTEIDTAIKCIDCGYTFEADTMTEHEGNHYCTGCFALKYVKCDECGEIHTNFDDITVIDDKNYCESCRDDTYVQCSDCDDWIDKDDSYYTTKDGDTICDSCYCDNYFTCERCENIHHNNDATEVHDQYYCERCIARYYFRCDRCNSWESNDDIRTVNGTYWCEDCYVNHAIECEDCGDSFDYDDIVERDGNYYCPDCAGHHEEDSSGIHDCGYKPEPIFIRGKNSNDKMFFGFELEIETPSKSRNGDIAEQIVNDNWYFKNDGSLKTGFEIVSHPFNWSGYKENKKAIESMLNTLIKEECSSHDAGTCGMHIHVSKNHFTCSHLFKVMKFFRENQKFILKISQRKLEQLNNWATLDVTNRQIIYKAKTKTNGNSKRYVAINITRHTVEFRIFRGTIKKQRFFKNVEFVKAIIDYAEKESMNDVSLERFMKYVTDNKKTFPNFHSFIN